jgi:hypothetical protein
MTHNLLVLRFVVLFFLILNPVKNIKEAGVAGVVVAVIFVFLINKKLRQALFKYSLFH